MLADFIQSLHGTVVALGDWNGEKTEHLMHPVTSIPDFDLGKTPPTEKGRTIDFVGVKGRHVTQVRRTVIDGTSSDHKPVKARISFEERLKYQGLGTK